MHNILEALIWSVALFFLFWIIAGAVLVIAVKRQIKKVKAALGETAGGDITESLFSLFTGAASNTRFMTMGKTVKVKYDPVEGTVMEETITDADGTTRRRSFRQNPKTGNWEEATQGSNQRAFAAIDAGESDAAPTIDAEIVDTGATQQPRTKEINQTILPPERPSSGAGMKPCPNCSSLMKADDNFCISCGHAVGI